MGDDSEVLVIYRYMQLFYVKLSLIKATSLVSGFMFKS